MRTLPFNVGAGGALLTLSALLIGTAEAAVAVELAIAQGAVTVGQPPSGMRSPKCEELVVEARDGFDNHLISQTKPSLQADGTCVYALSVPAQSAVWLRVRPRLVSAVGPSDAPPHADAVSAPIRGGRTTFQSVQIRFRVIAPTTFFFEPGEKKNVPLAY